MKVCPSQPHLTFNHRERHNPSTLLPTQKDGEKHNCLSKITASVLPRSDLADTPFDEADMTMFADGSSRKNPDGTNATGFAVVTAKPAKPLPKHYSAQAAELLLTEACEQKS